MRGAQGRTICEHAVFDAMTAAARTTGAWDEVDAVVASLDADGFEIVTAMEAFAIAAMRQAAVAPWWGFVRRHSWQAMARKAVQVAESVDFQDALSDAIAERNSRPLGALTDTTTARSQDIHSPPADGDS